MDQGQKQETLFSLDMLNLGKLLKYYIDTRIGLFITFKKAHNTEEPGFLPTQQIIVTI